MSIETQLEELNQIKSDILTSIAAKGVTVPTNSGLKDAAGLIDTIEQGGGFDGYETDFSNFDFTQKIDIPQKGFLTFYDTHLSYSYDNGLKITVSSNLESHRCLGFYANAGSVCEVELEFICSSSNFAFLWITEDLNIASSPTETDKLLLMANSSYTPLEIDISYIKTDYGYKYYNTNISNSGTHKVKVVYGETDFSIYIDDVFLARYANNTGFCQINPSPRNGAYIILKKIKF